MKKCINCCQDIEAARLRAIPTTEFCIKCARAIGTPKAREKFVFSLSDEPIEQENSFD
jgi:RNA polymerase-binding transcription factor DksA